RLTRPTEVLKANTPKRRIGQPRLDLTSRPLLTQHDSAVPIQADDVERVLADINADDGNCADNLGHGALLVCCAGSQHTTGQVGARPDIPLADMRWRQLLFG